MGDDDRSAGPILVFLGGVWIFPANLFLWSGDWQGESTPHHGPGGWALKEFAGIDLALYSWWPWIGILAGPVILLSLWGLQCMPHHKNALIWVVIGAAVANLLFGMAAFLASVLVVIGALIIQGRLPEPPRYN